MLYAGLDLSRKRLDFHLLDAEGATVERGASPPDADGLRGLSERLARHGEPIRAAIESMNGARFVHDRLALHGWQVEIADAQKVKGRAPLACKTDRTDAWVLAELARRDPVPAIWLPDPQVRAERERARWRLHLVRHRSSLKQRVHAVPRSRVSGRSTPATSRFTFPPVSSGSPTSSTLRCAAFRAASRPIGTAAPGSCNRDREAPRFGWHTRCVIEQLRAAAEALNQGDPEPFAALIADDAEWRGISHGHLWWKRTPV